MNTSKKSAYASHNVMLEISSAINLLCMEYEKCTPTDVLRLCKFSETKEMRSLCLEIAEIYGFKVKSSGRGYVILDW